MNDEDWFRKRLRNRRPGCVLGLPLGLLALLAGALRHALTVRDERSRQSGATLGARRR